MDKVKKIKELLGILDLPKKQQTDICTLTILSMANLKKKNQMGRSDQRVVENT